MGREDWVGGPGGLGGWEGGYRWRIGWGIRMEGWGGMRGRGS